MCPPTPAFWRARRRGRWCCAASNRSRSSASASCLSALGHFVLVGIQLRHRHAACGQCRRHRDDVSDRQDDRLVQDDWIGCRCCSRPSPRSRGERERRMSRRGAVGRLAGAAVLSLAVPAAGGARRARMACERAGRAAGGRRSSCRIWPSGCATRQPVKIVAIGGASTKGAAAGAPDLAYPHRLQVALAGVLSRTCRSPSSTRACRANRRSRWWSGFRPTCSPRTRSWWSGRPASAMRCAASSSTISPPRCRPASTRLKNRAIDILLVDMQFSRSDLDGDRFRALSEYDPPRRRAERRVRLSAVCDDALLERAERVQLRRGRRKTSAPGSPPRSTTASAARWREAIRIAVR